MANLSQMINRKTAADEQWKAQRQADRENAAAIQNAAMTEVTRDPEKYAHYLDMQGDNPTYSPGNVVMVMVQNPEFSKFGTAERWKNLGRSVMPSEQKNGVSIFARSNVRRGYDLAPVYDISQTTGRDIPEMKLEDGSTRMETALNTLLNYSVVPFEESAEIPIPALYSDTELKIYFNPNFTESESFGSLAAAIAHSRFHAKGYNQNYDRNEFDLDAQSVAYTLCRRFGIQTEKPNLQNLTALYAGYNSDQCRSALTHIHEMSKQIGNNIAHKIEPPQKSRAVSHAAI